MKVLQPYKIIKLNSQDIPRWARRPFTAKMLKKFQRDKLNCYTVLDSSTGKISTVGGACRR